MSNTAFDRAINFGVTDGDEVTSRTVIPSTASIFPTLRWKHSIGPLGTDIISPSGKKKV